MEEELQSLALTLGVSTLVPRGWQSWTLKRILLMGSESFIHPELGCDSVVAMKQPLGPPRRGPPVFVSQCLC